MRAFLIAMVFGLVVSSVGAAPARAWTRNEVRQDTFRLSETDKQLHYVGSYALALTSTAFFRSQGFNMAESVLISSILTLGFMSAKELYMDRYYSQGDQVANILGVLTNVGVSFSINF